MAKFDRKWPKMWPTCIFRPGEGSEGLKSDFGGKNQIWPNLVGNGQKCGQHAFLGLGRVQNAKKSDFGGKNQI